MRLFPPLFHKLLRDLKQRVVLITALIFILAVGVCSYIGMMCVAKDLQQAQTQYYRSYHLADFTIDVEKAPNRLAASLKNLPNIARLRTRIRTPIMIKRRFMIPGEAISMPVPRASAVNDIMLHSGAWFSYDRAYEAILEAQFAKANHLKVGDRIQILLPNKEYTVLVVGTAYSPEFTMVLPPGNVISPDPAKYGVVYMPRGFLEQAADLNKSFNQLIGMTQDRYGIAIQNTMRRITDRLDAYGVKLQTAQSDQISVKVLHDELQNLYKFAEFFPTLFLLVAIMIFNVMMNRLVWEQRGIIGILKSIGYGNAAIMRHYLLYGAVIGLLGGVIGISAGVWLQQGMLYMYRTYFSIPNLAWHFYPSISAIGILIGVGCAVLSAVWSVFRAVRMRPAESMRPQLPEFAHKIFLERFSALWKRLSFQNKMALRTIFRNRFRSAVTLLAAALASGIVFNALSFLDSIDAMVAFSFDRVQHQDFQLTLRDPLGKKIQQTLWTLPSVVKMETQLTVPAEIKHGERIKRMEIIGLPAVHDLFTPVNAKGRAIQIPDDGLVLTESLAKTLRAKVGDTLSIRPLLGFRETVSARVKKIVPQAIGFAIYTNQDWLSRLIRNVSAFNQVLFKLKPQTDIEAFMTKIYQFAPLVNLTNTRKSRTLLVDTMNRFMTVTILVMILFAGIIAVGAIINTAVISLSERERQVASLRILGLTHLETAKIFFTESVLLNIIGIFLGLGFGIGLTYYMSEAFSTELFTLPFVIKFERLAAAVVIMCGFVLISQVMIYQMIKRVRWFDILNIRE